MSARVLLIGAGGLGGPIAYALAAAEVALTVCDDDVVELSNLQRQVQFSAADIGRPKVVALADELVRRGHERSSVTPVQARFGAGSAAQLLADADLVIDASDDFATKFAVNDQAMARGLPVVISAALRYTGQIFALDTRARNAREQGCYRCLFEAPPAAEEDDGQSCAQAGVLGATVAYIGGLAARLALCLAFARPLSLDAPAYAGAAGPGGLWTIADVRDARPDAPARLTRFAIRSHCPACAARPTTSDSHPKPQGQGVDPWRPSASRPLSGNTPKAMSK